MTREEIMTLGFEELEERKAAIAVETDEADAEVIETLNAELEIIEERKKALDLEIEERNAAAEAVIAGAGVEIETRKEEKQMTNMEVRKTHEYIEAFAKYVKTGKDLECRALLTENVENGTVPVPEFVEGRVRAKWESDEAWRRFRKTYVRGNLKVGFELSATDAAIHQEGDLTGPAEEILTLGIVNMIPANVKKWITISDEVLALGAEEFLAYIYDEIAYKIIQKVIDGGLFLAITENSVGDAQSVGVPEVTGPVSAATIISAMAQLGSEARDLVFVANGAIIGDLSGIQVNMPEGETIRFKFDDLSLAEHDMVKVVGRLYCAIAITTPGMLVRITPGN